MKDAEIEELVGYLEECCGTNSFPAVYANVIIPTSRKLQSTGHREPALRILQAALDQLPKENPLRPTVATEIALPLQNQKEWAGAMAVLDDALRFVDKSENPAGWAALQSLRADLFRAMGTPDLGAPLLREAVRILEDLHRLEQPVKAQLSNAYQRLANLRLAQRDGDLLIAETTRALTENAKLFESPRQTGRVALEVRLAVANMLDRRNAERMALARRQLQKALADPAIRAQDALTCELRLADFALQERDFDHAGSLIAAVTTRLNTMGTTAETIDWATVHALESQKERMEGVLTPAVLRNLETRVRELLERYSREPPREGGTGHLRFRRNLLPLTEILRRNLDIDVAQAFQWLLDFHAPSTLARNLGVSQVTVDEVQSLLTSETQGLLAYFTGSDQSFVFALDRSSLTCTSFHWGMEGMEDCKRLSELVRQRPFELRDDDARRRRTEAIEELTRRLAERVFPRGHSSLNEPPTCQDADIADQLRRWDAITIFGSDLMSDPPWEILPVNGGLLGTTIALGRLPNASVGVALARRDSSVESTQHALCLVANVPHGEEVLARYPDRQPLSVEESQVRSLVAPFGEERCTVLQGEQASRHRLVDTLQEGSRILHLLTHGIRRAEENAPGLILAPHEDDPGLLFSEHVVTLPSPPLVVVSACNAGSGAVRVGDEGTTDLSGAFWIAGAQTLLIANMETTLEATLPMTTRFHEEVAQGVTPAEALRRARTSLLQDDRFADPYYWAASRLMGRAHQPLFESTNTQAAPTKRPEKRIVTALAVLAASAVGILVTKKLLRPSPS